MTKLRIREQKHIYTLYQDTLELPDPKIYKLNYGDKAYDVKRDVAYIYKGGAAGWVVYQAGLVKPTAPTSLAGVPTHDEIDFTWTKSIDGPMDSYRIYFDGVLKQEFTGDVATGKVTGLPYSTHFQNITVRGVLAGVESLDSNSIDVVTHSAPAEFSAEFSMEDDTKKFSFTASPAADAQYSTDGNTWTDGVATNVTGSTKYYVRHKPGTAGIHRISFKNAEIKSIDSIDLGELTTFPSFEKCALLETVAMTDTSKIISFGHREGSFQYCTKLSTVPLFDLSNTTSMTSTFANTGITSLPALDFSNVLNMERTFQNCDKLVKAPVINSTKATTVKVIFGGCTLLQCVGGLDSRAATDRGGRVLLFTGCPALQHPTSAEVTALESTSGSLYSYNCP